MIFVDTSAFYAVLDRDDAVHEPARATWATRLADPETFTLVTSNYVLVESCALIQARLGNGGSTRFPRSGPPRGSGPLDHTGRSSVVVTLVMLADTYRHVIH